ncbi:MAG TPA: hydroxymethylglutaryl-CoA lyase [Pseudomonadales bacterium]|nr:hydroxymethylglutaryl-CoA lyase [Pseudomonadales bacterium]
MPRTHLTLMEVSPRDGLQNEPDVLSTESKLALIEAALDAGVRRIEVASFVNPRKVPQMADAEAVCAVLPERDDVRYTGLVLNRRGAERAIATGRLHELGMVVVASDAFGMRNQGMSAEGSVDAALEVFEVARAAGIAFQVTIATAFGCPFEGEVPRERVIAMAERLATGGPTEIALADTVGVGVPSQVLDLFPAIRARVGADVPLRAHFHNTRGTGIANAFAALQAGVEVLDASIGGVGGCPFAPRATGNIATEDLLYMLDRMGLHTGVSLAGVLDASARLAEMLGRELPAMVSRAGGFPQGEAA